MKKAFLSCLMAIAIFTLSGRAEFQVNTRTSGSQAMPAVAIDAAGNFVVVWRSYGQIASGDIFGQRFEASGDPTGNEFQINTETSGNQTKPDVAMDAAGNFVVVWHGPGVSEENIFARRFDANGTPDGNEFCVNNNANNRQLYPAIAMHDNGNFVVVWESINVPSDPNKRSILGRVYDNTGAAVGSEFDVSQEPAIYRYPNVAMFSTGEFIAVWTKDSSTNSIFRRRFDVVGDPLINAVTVSDIGFTSLTEPSVAVNTIGCYAVVWDGHAISHTLDDVHLRRYRWTNFPLEPSIINSYQDGAQKMPVVGMSDDGRFAMVWQSETEAQSTNIFERRFPSQCENLGAPIFIGNELVVNTYTADKQESPDLAMGGDGKFVVVWQSNGQDGSGWGIFGRMGTVVESADFTGDGFIDFSDFCILADDWLEEECACPADLTNDHRVDQYDLDAFKNRWLTAE